MKAIAFGIGGVFIMSSLLFAMAGALVLVASSLFQVIPFLVITAITAWIGFYMIGAGLEVDETN